MNKSNIRTGLVGALAVALVFTGGYATGATLFATRVNQVLASAFHAVGQSLFGSAAFGVFAPSEPTPANPIRLDFADNIRLPVALNVFRPANPFAPLDPCHSYLQVKLTGGVAVLTVDSSAAPEGFSTTLIEADLSGIRPRTSQCPAPAPVT